MPTAYRKLIFLNRKYGYLFFSLVLFAISIVTISDGQDAHAENAKFSMKEFQTPPGTHPHDVAVDPEKDGPVWFTAQGTGYLGKLDPKTGNVTLIQLGNATGTNMNGSAPHGVNIGPDKALWITDEFQKAIVRVDPNTHEITKFPIPNQPRYTLLNTGTFDKSGVLWFTDRSGFYGKLDPAEGKVHYWDAPRGFGPYGITTTPDGSVYFNSWYGNYTAKIDLKTGNLTLLEPPTKDSMPRRIWSDSKGQLWVTEWAEGKLAKYDPATAKWQEWKLPGDGPDPYAVYVDENDKVWVSDFEQTNGKQSIFRFDPETEKFDVIPLPSDHANVRQIHGREGEIWGAEWGLDKIMVIKQESEK